MSDTPEDDDKKKPDKLTDKVTLNRRQVLQALSSVSQHSFIGTHQAALAEGATGSLMPLYKIGDMLEALSESAMHLWSSPQVGPFFLPGNALTEEQYADYDKTLESVTKSLIMLSTQPKEHIHKALEHWKLSRMRKLTLMMQEELEEFENLKLDVEELPDTPENAVERAARIRMADPSQQMVLRAAMRDIEIFENATPETLLEQLEDALQTKSMNFMDLIKDPQKLPEMLEQINEIAEGFKARVISLDQIAENQRRFGTPYERPMPQIDAATAEAPQITNQPELPAELENLVSSKASLKQLFDHVGNVGLRYYIGEEFQEVCMIRVAAGDETFDRMNILEERIDYLIKHDPQWAKIEMSRRGDMLTVYPATTAHADEVSDVLFLLKELADELPQEKLGRTHE